MRGFDSAVRAPLRWRSCLEGGAGEPAPARGGRTLRRAPPRRGVGEEMPNFTLPPRRRGAERGARSRAGGGGAGARRSGQQGGPAAGPAPAPR